MFTMAGWSESVPLTTVQQALAAIPDEHIRVEGDNIVVPSLNKIVGYYGIGVDIQNVQLASPQLRRTFLLDVAPVETTALPVFPPDFPNRVENPVSLVSDENLSANSGNSNAGAQQENVFVILADGQLSHASGEVHSLRATATAPATAYGWANAQLTLTQTLPVGTYDLVGARCEQANTIAFRFVQVGGIWRPGTLAVTGPDSKDVALSRYGAMGKWFSFPQLTPPTVDFFGDGTGGAATLWLDLIKRS